MQEDGMQQLQQENAALREENATLMNDNINNRRCQLKLPMRPECASADDLAKRSLKRRRRHEDVLERGGPPSVVRSPEVGIGLVGWQERRTAEDASGACCPGGDGREGGRDSRRKLATSLVIAQPGQGVMRRAATLLRFTAQKGPPPGQSHRRWPSMTPSHQITREVPCEKGYGNSALSARKEERYDPTCRGGARRDWRTHRSQV